MNTTSRTRLAILGTLSELHGEPIPYDLNCLRKLIADLAPDLLCAEITPEAWEGGDLAGAVIEVREALAPLAAATDIVLIPVAPTHRQFDDFYPAAGWRRDLARAFGRALAWGQREAGKPEAIDGPVFGAFCHTLCLLTESIWTEKDRAAWEAHNQAMAENILQAAQRDPDRRMLVVAQCQRVHRLAALLHAHSETIELTSYQEL